DLLRAEPLPVHDQLPCEGPEGSARSASPRGDRGGRPRRGDGVRTLRLDHGPGGEPGRAVAAGGAEVATSEGLPLSHARRYALHSSWVIAPMRRVRAARARLHSPQSLCQCRTGSPPAADAMRPRGPCAPPARRVPPGPPLAPARSTARFHRAEPPPQV